MNDHGLEDYLSRLGHRGQARESFTIDLRQALLKMATHQMPTPGLWAVKLVQGAVAAGATRVDFKLSRRTLHFRAFGDFPASAVGLLEQVLGTHTAIRRADRHWATALRAALGRRPQQLTLVTVAGREMQRISVTSSGAIQSEVSRLDRSQTNYRLLVRLDYADNDGPLGDEFRELCQRCYLCPIPLVVNGRDVIRENLPYWTSHAEPLRPGEETLELGITPQRGTEAFHFRGAERLHPGRHQCAFFLGLMLAQAPVRPEVYWLRDGALLGPHPVDFAPLPAQVQIVLPGDHCELDLSEWAVRQPDADLPAERIIAAANGLLLQLGNAEQSHQALRGRDQLLLGSGVGLTLLVGNVTVAGLLLFGAAVGVAMTPRSYGPPDSLRQTLARLASADNLRLLPHI